MKNVSGGVRRSLAAIVVGLACLSAGCGVESGTGANAALEGADGGVGVSTSAIILPGDIECAPQGGEFCPTDGSEFYFGVLHCPFRTRAAARTACERYCDVPCTDHF